MSKISILGAGSWGSALSRILGDNGHDVILYDTCKNTVDEINTFHTNSSKLPNGVLPQNITATTSIKEAVKFSNIIVISIPTKVLREVLKQVNEVVNTKKLFVNTSKGLEPDTFYRVSEVVYQEINNDYIDGFVALTGPSHAEEVVLKLLTTICSVSNNKEHAKLVQSLFNNKSYFRVYTGSDLLGSELCSALKNVYAIASGMLAGIGAGDNARAGLISRALVEMKRFVVAAGAKEDTIYGLTGLGDLVVTTTSNHSRNFQAGVKFATGSNLKETIQSMNMVVEGARTAEAAYKKSKELGIETPIINAVYHVIYNQEDVKQAISDLMSRSLKDE